MIHPLLEKITSLNITYLQLLTVVGTFLLAMCVSSFVYCLRGPWRIILGVWVMAAYGELYILNDVVFPDHHLLYYLERVYILFLLLGFFNIVGVIESVRQALHKNFPDDDLEKESYHKDMCVIARNRRLWGVLSFLACWLFLYIADPVYASYLVPFLNYSVYGIDIHVFIVLGLCIYGALILEPFIQNLILSILRRIKSEALDVVREDIEYIVTKRAFVFLSSVALLLVFFLLFYKIQNNQIALLATHVFLYSYFFYAAIVFADMLKHIVPEYIIRHRIILHACVRVIKILIGTVRAVTILEMCGIRTSAIVTSIGISGAAIAFASKNVIENIISGVVIIVEKPFEIKDYIKIPGLAEGTVRDLGFHYTELELPSTGSFHAPNSIVLERGIENCSRAKKRRIDFDVTIYSNTPSTTINKIISDIHVLLSTHELFVEEGTTIVPSDTPDARLILSIITFSRATDFVGWTIARGEFIKEIKRILEENHIETAVPHQVIEYAPLKG